MARSEQHAREVFRQAAPLIKANRYNLRQASTSLGRSQDYLGTLIHHFREAWRDEAIKMGLPDVWGSSFKGIRASTRQILWTAARMVASGFPVTVAAVLMRGDFAALGIDTNEKAEPSADNTPTRSFPSLTAVRLESAIRNNRPTWKIFVDHWRKDLGIPDGWKATARLVPPNGRGKKDGKPKGPPLRFPTTRPTWDAKSGELRFLGRLARRVDTKRAKNAALILDEFAKRDFASPVFDPLRGENGLPNPLRLRQAVLVLNRGLKYIRFRTEGGDTITWERTKSPEGGASLTRQVKRHL